MPGGPAPFTAASIPTAFPAVPGAIVPIAPQSAPSARLLNRAEGRRRQPSSHRHWRSSRRPLSTPATSKHGRRGVSNRRHHLLPSAWRKRASCPPHPWGGLVRVARAAPSTSRSRLVVDVGPASAPSSDSIAPTFVPLRARPIVACDRVGLINCFATKRVTLDPICSGSAWHPWPWCLHHGKNTKLAHS